MKKAKTVVLSSSGFCSLMILNGFLVAGACYAFVRPTYVERMEEKKDNATKMEVMYLGALFGLGPLLSTMLANAALPFILRERSSGDEGEEPRGKTHVAAERP
jgi:hypothetical protein